jgi:hypothetical protein
LNAGKKRGFCRLLIGILQIGCTLLDWPQKVAAEAGSFERRQNVHWLKSRAISAGAVFAGCSSEFLK